MPIVGYLITQKIEKKGQERMGEEINTPKKLVITLH
jgi:hypothetical protein